MTPARMKVSATRKQVLGICQLGGPGWEEQAITGGGQGFCRGYVCICGMEATRQANSRSYLVTSLCCL